MAKIYLIIIFITICVLAGLNSIFALFIYNVSALQIASVVLTSVALVVIIDTFFAIFIGILPKVLFSIKNPCFYVSKKQQKFYESLKIRKWKDYVWELGWLGGFSKRKIKSTNDPKYFEKFIIESNRGMTEHCLGMVFGFSIIAPYPQYVWSIGLPIDIMNVILNVLPTMILRYNSPKLRSIHKGLLKRELKHTKNLGGN